MKRVCLKPIPHVDAYTEALSKVIGAYFKEVLIEPLEGLVEAHGLGVKAKWNNAAMDNPLSIALREGHVWYDDGNFVGQFNAQISKELRDIGARKSLREEGGWILPLDKMPLATRMAVYESKQKADNLTKEAITLLMLMRGAVGESDTGIDITQAGSSIALDVQKKFAREAKSSGLVLDVSSQGENKPYIEPLNDLVSDASREVMIRKIDATIEKIKVGSSGGATITAIKKTLKELSEEVATASTAIGEHAAATIVSGKRKDLAVLSGSDGYIWRTMMDSRVRHDHSVLEGTFQSWDSPPVTNTSTGDKNHPGEDYNCRCSCGIIIPIRNLE